MSTDAHDHPRAFVSAEYDHGHAGLEVLDAGGTGDAPGGSSGGGGAWRGATVYTHRGTGSLVLWFGGDEYEGIGGSYRWFLGGRCAEVVAGTPCGPRLLDSDGDVIPTRAAPPSEGSTESLALPGGHAPVASVRAAQVQATKGASRFLPFEEALVFVRSLRLKNQAEWFAWCKSGARPANIPSNPQKVYQHSGWRGYGHWLGTGTVADHNKVFLPFDKALVFVRSLRLKGWTEWKAWSKSGARSANIPGHPQTSYRHDGWQGMGHWLGTGTVAHSNRAFLPFEEALVFVRSLGLKSRQEWRTWSKSGARPADVPGNPHKAYAHAGWQGIGHWLGTGTVANHNKVFLRFEEALVFARSLKLKSRTEWKAWSKSGARAADIPGCPEKAYAHDGWQGIGHWLGTDTQHGGRRDPPTHAPAAVAGTAHPPHQRPSRKRSATSQAVSSSKQPAAARVWD